MLFYKLICLFLSFIIIIIHGKDISSTKKLLKSGNLNNKIKKGRERYGGIYNSKYMTIEKRRKYNYIKKQKNNNNSYFSYCNVYKNNDVNNNYTAYNYYINNPKNKLKEYYEKIKNHVIKKKKENIFVKIFTK